MLQQARRPCGSPRFPQPKLLVHHLAVEAQFESVQAEAAGEFFADFDAADAVSAGVEWGGEDADAAPAGHDVERRRLLRNRQAVSSRDRRTVLAVSAARSLRNLPRVDRAPDALAQLGWFILIPSIGRSPSRGPFPNVLRWWSSATQGLTVLAACGVIRFVP